MAIYRQLTLLDCRFLNKHFVLVTTENSRFTAVIQRHRPLEWL